MGAITWFVIGFLLAVVIIAYNSSWGTTISALITFITNMISWWGKIASNFSSNTIKGT